MAFYSDEVLDEVRNANDIVEVVSAYVTLRQRGGRLWGLCPFHREKSPSFTVRPEMGSFHCFGCSVGGNVFTFVMRIENLGFVDAVKSLADRARITLPENTNVDSGLAKLRESIYEANKVAAQFYFNCLKGPTGEIARNYLVSRRIKNSIASKFGLGYAPGEFDGLYKIMRSKSFDDDVLESGGLVVRSRSGGLMDKFRNRLMFPIIDASGRVVGFGGRSFDGENSNRGPKYLNSPETPVFSKNRQLFSLNFARKVKSETVLIVEGYMDVLALFQAGFECAAATLGTAMGREHARVLNRYLRGRTAVLLFDSDSAGEAALLRAIPVLRHENVKIKVLRLENAKDPDEFIMNYGRDAFADEITKALHPTDFLLNIERNKFKDRTNSLAYATAAADVLAGITDPIEQSHYLNKVVDETKLDIDAIRSRIAGAHDAIDMSVILNAERTEKKEKGEGLDFGLIKAYRSVLYHMANTSNYYQSIKEAVSEEEILSSAYKKLYNAIRLKRDNTGGAACDLMNLYPEEKELQDVANIVFTSTVKANSEDELRNTLNQEIRLIKAEYLKDLIPKSQMSLWQTLNERLKTLPKSYI